MPTSLALAALAIALAMDAFAVALVQGAASRSRIGDAVRIGAVFGLAQGLMPLLGWLLGLAFMAVLAGIDHWVALVLLGMLGIRMIREGLNGIDPADRKPLLGWRLLTAAVATSIDAFAAGITLPALSVPVGLACITIGLVTALLCAGGVLLGGAAGARTGKAADIFGGLVLIGLGIKIFVEHEFLGG